MTTEHGHVVAVNAEKLGDTLDANAALGAITLIVGDVADFDELGGSLRINGAVLAYSTCDDDAGTVTLTDALPAAAELGDPVHVWDTQRLTVAMEYVAQVAVDDDDEGDPIEAVIASHLVEKLSSGIRGLVGESVLMEYDEEDEEWRVIDVLGLADESGVKFWQDSFTLAAGGAQDLQLTYLPILNSEHVYWNGLYQPQVTAWTRAEKTISILGSESLAGHVIGVEYAYLDGSYSPPVEHLPSFVQRSGSNGGDRFGGDTLAAHNLGVVGDKQILGIATHATITPTLPSGWTQFSSTTSAHSRMTLYERTLTAGNLSSDVVLTWTGQGRSEMRTYRDASSFTVAGNGTGVISPSRVVSGILIRFVSTAEDNNAVSPPEKTLTPDAALLNANSVASFTWYGALAVGDDPAANGATAPARTAVESHPRYPQWVDVSVTS